MLSFIVASVFSFVSSTVSFSFCCTLCEFLSKTFFHKYQKYQMYQEYKSIKSKGSGSEHDEGPVTHHLDFALCCVPWFSLCPHPPPLAFDNVDTFVF